MNMPMNAQVISLLRLSHKNVLPSSSYCALLRKRSSQGQVARSFVLLEVKAQSSRNNIKLMRGRVLRFKL